MRERYNLLIELGERKDRVLEAKFVAESDEIAAAIMSDILIAFAKHSVLSVGSLNANLHKLLWVNGI